MSRLKWAIISLGFFSACAPEIPEDERPSDSRVSAVFDVDTATIPLPNNAALDSDGTLPNRPGDAAQGEFNSWLGQATGWNPTTPITVPFSGRLAQSSLDGAVTLYSVSEAGELSSLEFQLIYEENSDDAEVCNSAVCSSQLRVVPATGLQPGARYALAVTNSLRGSDSESVLASSALYLALSTQPLVDGNGQSTVSSVDSGTAARIEGLRRLISPVVEALSVEGIQAEELVSLNVWSTSENVFTVLDPATSTLPIPNTLALDSDGTFPRNALNFCGPTSSGAACEESSDCSGVGQLCVRGACTLTRCAQGTFDTYLDGLHGWPTTTPITLPLTGEIDPETVTTSTVQVWRVGEAGLERVDVSVEYSAEARALLITPAQEMSLNTQYVAFATQGLTGANGLPVLAPPAVAMSVQPHPVADENGNSLVAEIPNADAARIEAIRQGLRPVVEVANARTGLSHEDLAAFWVWGTWSDSFVAFDPSAAVLAFPNAFLTAGCADDRPICLLYNPAAPPEDPLQAQLFDELSQRTGFSVSATNWLPTEGAPLASETVTKDHVLVAEVTDIPPPPLEPEEYEVRYEFGHVLVDFNRPLTPDTLIAGFATNGMLGSNGFGAQPSPAFVFLRSQYALIDDQGVSQIDALDDATAALLEDARQQYADLWLAAAVLGFDREDVVSAWAYQTQKTYEPLQQLRGQALAKLALRGELNGYRACGLDCADDPYLEGPLPEDFTVPHPNDATQEVSLGNVEWIQWRGELDSLNFFDANRRVLGFDDVVTERIGVSVFVPRASNCTPPYDVVIAQHGNGDWRQSMGVSMANTLAEKCLVTVAMDLPLHGGRSASSQTLHPDERPADSGENFIGLDLVGTKGSLWQSVIDLVVLTKHIRAGALDDMVELDITDETSTIGYVGISMGGFVGTLLSALEPEVGPVVLNVAGGNYGVLLRDSEVFSSLLDGAVEVGTFGYLQTLHFIQWLGEQADPYIFARHLTRDPLEDLLWDPGDESYIVLGNVPLKEVLVQMAQDDATVPNSSTLLLAQELGVSLENTTFEGIEHGFLVSADESAQTMCAREQSAEWIRSGLDGDATLPVELYAATCSGGQ